MKRGVRELLPARDGDDDEGRSETTLTSGDSLVDSSIGIKWRDEGRASARPQTSCSGGKAAPAATTSQLCRSTSMVRAVRTSSSAGQ
ncbi:hypothetical protein Syun_029685 [Stephania yunnanensis]|uniref:Uncharacterized protein n=1 Tax=Stephania yunnanensis TaxID=152371 RepID=A0AAP0E629_9MAGN